MSDDDQIRTIEVCFTPLLFPQRITNKNFVVVIVDILRATSAICAAFDNGAMEVIPVARLEETVKYKGLGYKIAGERDGMVIEGADFGNSPFDFTKENVNGEKIVITTTNGTQTIETTKFCDTVVLGAFSNISVLTDWLDSQLKNVVILCSGWKNNFNIEDSVFAGALVQRLIQRNNYKIISDSTMAACDLWNLAKNNLRNYIEKATHLQRLKKLKLDDAIEYCITEDTTTVIPILYGGKLVNAIKKK